MSKEELILFQKHLLGCRRSVTTFKIQPGHNPDLAGTQPEYFLCDYVRKRMSLVQKYIDQEENMQTTESSTQ
jgi:hypothetical protein